MRYAIRKQSLQTVISPIYERCQSDIGIGLVGFTVQVPSQPFMNHIRFYNSDNRLEKLSELIQLREQLLDMLDEATEESICRSAGHYL
ncbi:MAG: hypothetical protein CVU49_00540 [Candidatus Cloacimonetes bacterium HGW-Cloacimonetes-2]|jgi:hypothetical protein|nr:MAG: hypothetical protein CVU49_00540 [Candidatus Cloacimonetes bacterium HGW-Cloacimonetes-2]